MAKVENVLAAALFACITGAAVSNSPDLSKLETATKFGPFSSREVASAALIVVLLSWATATSPETRRSLIKLLPSTVFLLKWTLIVFGYFGAVVGILFVFEIWHIGLTVPTLLWVLTAGTMGAFRSMSSEDQPMSLKKLFSISLFAGWIVGIYTFAFSVELVYLSLSALVAGMAVVAEKHNPKAYSLVNYAYGILVVAALIPPIIGLIQRPLDRIYIESFMVPVVGFLALLTLVRVLALYVVYEGIGLRLRLYSGSDAVRRYALWQCVLHFHVRLAALRRFRTLAARDLFWAKSREDVDEVLTRYGRGGG